MAQFELRSFQADDAGAVWALHDEALDDAGVHGGRGPWEDDLRDIEGFYLEPGGEFLVGMVEARLVGMGGLLRRSPEVGEIKRMRVHPDRQRQGLGRMILDELESRAIGLGCREIQLDTTSEQVGAQRLYEGAGYEEIGRRQAERFLFIDYRKELGL